MSRRTLLFYPSPGSYLGRVLARPAHSTNPNHMIKNPTLRYKLITGKRDYRFVIQSRNGNVIATGVGYARKANALKSLNLLKPANAPVEIVS